MQAPGKFCDGTHYILRGPTSNEEMVVLIHGMKTYHSCFNRLATKLAESGFLTLQYDLLGRGFSVAPADGKYGDLEHVGQLLDLIEHLNLPKRLHIIGHSQGGAVAVMFTSHYWRMVISLTLLAPAGLMKTMPLGIIKRGPLLRTILKSSMRGKAAREKGCRADFHAHSGEALALENEYVEDLNRLYDARPDVFEAVWSTLMQFPLSGIEPNISQVGENISLRVLLMWGREDESIKFEPSFDNWSHQFNMTHCYFNSIVVEKAGHAFFIEKHEEVNQSILAFLLSVRP